MRFVGNLGIAAFACLFVGCQNIAVTERFQDRIDCIADREGHLDNWYRPGKDLSRINQPDWYDQSPKNQRKHDANKVRGRRPLPAYEHNPIFIPEEQMRSPIFRESLTSVTAPESTKIVLADPNTIAPPVLNKTADKNDLED